MPITSYSQVGEDIQIAYLLGKHREVSYIDVGCLWPIEHSNTYFFYERGGVGLCIDPNPSIEFSYRKVRPRDTFVNCGVGAASGSLTYIMHENPVFNTFSHARAERVRRQSEEGQRGREEIDAITVDLKPLDQIIQEAAILDHTDGHIDFISVDVEGFEHDVVKGMDFTRVRPTLIVVEHLGGRATGDEESPVEACMRNHGYFVAAYTGHDLFFMDGQH